MRATSSWLETWCRFSPEAEALVDLGTGQRWTWRQLRADATAWASWLARQGVDQGDVVAVIALNRGETVALLFACADLGAVLFPVNWRLAPAEIAWQLEHAAARIVLTDDANRHAVSDSHPLLTPEPGTPVDPVEPDLDATWQLMYTSGSSGRPKGALLTHRQVHWNALNTTLACDLTPADSTLTFTPLFHTGGMNCLTTPLLHRGGRVILAPKLDVGEALRVIEQEGITVLMGVPTIFQMMADHADFESTDLSSVRDALCGGAPLPLPLLRRYLDRGIPLRQGFGLTEVGPNCFSLPRADLERKAGTVGLPIHHIAAKVVRPDGTTCAPDEPGELLLKGPVVFAGYLDNPEATASSIVDGWFRTGDILSVDADGYFSVCGRKKEMFISGGENVYPAEVEAAIAELDGVALVAVIGVPDERWGEVGRAFVEPGHGRTLDGAAIRLALRERLARFKIPKQVMVLDALPRTGSGKIDKRALAALEVS